MKDCCPHGYPLGGAADDHCVECAITKERETCAKLAEDFDYEDCRDHCEGHHESEVGEDIAAAIRTRR